MAGWIRTAVLTLTILVLGTGMAFASDNNISLKVDGTTVVTDVSPIIQNGRTLVPYRALIEAIGGKVTWDDKTQVATATLGINKVQLTINSKTGIVNGLRKHWKYRHRSSREGL